MLTFFCRSIQVLVSTDCAGMGVHVPDLRLVVNVGMTMIDIFSQKCSLHTRNLWKVPQTFGRAGRDEKLQAVGEQMYWPGQKGLLISIFISIAMHATHATIITTERTTRPQASLLEMKFQFYRQDHSSRQSEGDFHWTRLPQSCHQRCIHPQQCPQ